MTERTVRIRFKIDNPIDDELQGYRNSAIKLVGIVESTNQCSNQIGQYFFSTYGFRYMPSSQNGRGSTIDIALRITAADYLGYKPSEPMVNNQPGTLLCNTATPMAFHPISTEEDLKAYLENPDKDAYLAGDITVTTPIVYNSQMEYTLDGRGHTITYTGGESNKATDLTQEHCFFPYGEEKDELTANIDSYNGSTHAVDMNRFPRYHVIGGMFGKILRGGEVKNLTLKYTGETTYRASENMLFGLVAGVTNGRIENVAVVIDAQVNVRSDLANKPWAIGGLTGILATGVVKGCSVELNNKLNVTQGVSGAVNGESCLGGLIGRLQAGVVGNVKFCGSDAASMILMAKPAETYSRYYIGGVAGMTNTPKGVFCGDATYPKQLRWGYDNGTTGLDVNNVILSYKGKMEMGAASTGTHNYYCRGLLFGEATDTTTVPVLVTQYTTAPTVNAHAKTDASLPATGIPLASQTMGSCRSNQLAAPPTDNAHGGYVGQLYLYRDGRVQANKNSGIQYKFTNITKTDAVLNWGYEIVNWLDGNEDRVDCTSKGTSYVVATPTDVMKKDVLDCSSNVSYGGTASDGNVYAKIEPQPGTTTTATWNWGTDEHVTPPTYDQPVCGGTGGGATSGVMPNVDTYCEYTGTCPAGDGRFVKNVELNGETITINEKPTQNAPWLGNFGFTTPIEVVKGQSYTLTLTGGDERDDPFHWHYISVFADWNNSGTYDDGTFEYIGKKPDTQPDDSKTLTFNVDVPTDAATAYVRLRVICDYWANSTHVNPCKKTSTDNSNMAYAFDIMLRVVDVAGQPDAAGSGGAYGGAVTGYMTSGTNSNTAYMSAITISKNNTPVLEKENIASNVAGYQTYGPLTINSGETLDLEAVISQAPTAKTYKWTTIYVFADMNCNGSFEESELCYAGADHDGSQWNKQLPSGYIDLYGVSASTITVPETTKKSLTFTGVGSSLIRIMTIGEYRTAWDATAYKGYYNNTGNGNVDANGDGPDHPGNFYHCYDIPVTVNGGNANECYYSHNFGDVLKGATAAEHTFKIDIVPDGDVVTDNDLSDPYTCTYTAGELKVVFDTSKDGTYNKVGAFTFTSGGKTYNVNLKGVVKIAPKVRFQVGSSGGGKLSLDFGNTIVTSENGLAIDFDPYERQTVSAVPNGPTAVEAWYISKDKGATWEKLKVASTGADSDGMPDWQYYGSDDAIIEVRFYFPPYDGNFGLTKFTDTTVQPFSIKSIRTTGGIKNVNVDNLFPTFGTGAARYEYLSDQTLQTTLPVTRKRTHEITVEVKNIDKFSDDHRLLVFIDWNSNHYFEFDPVLDGLASDAKVGGELVYVGQKDGVGYSENNNIGTFTFTIKNDDINNDGNDTDPITNFMLTRMRVIATKYVDLYGLGPVNKHGNYSPRIDLDGDGAEDEEMPLNDNKGNRFESDKVNQCHMDYFVNAVDVNVDVVKYLKSDETLTIENGDVYHLGDIYIESEETESGIRSGQIKFNPSSPYGSVTIDGKIIVRKRIYENRWHDVAFPIEMQGTAGTQGVATVSDIGEATKLDNNRWWMYEYDSTKRNKQDGVNPAHKDADKTTLKANTFYLFAADNDNGANLGKEGGANYYWIQFSSTGEGFKFEPKQAEKCPIPYEAAEDATQYWNKNVFTIYNPYFSGVNIQEIRTSPDVGWMNITWWNAAEQKYKGVSASESIEMPPYFGYWVQFTEGRGTGNPINVVLGDTERTEYKSEEGRATFSTKSMGAPRTATFDMPDAYTIGINRAESGDESVTNTTIITLTDAGSVDEMRAGYDMPVSYASNSVKPEIWSKAGASRMMFNDVRREEVVVVPLGIRIHETGEYAIRLTHTNCNEALVQLRDKLTGAFVELQRDGESYSYAFLADKGDNERFELVIGAPKNMTDLDVVEMTDEAADMLIYKTGDVLRLQRVPVGYSVEVCDVVGREVLNATVTNDDMQLRLPAAQGVYLVSVRNAQGVQQQVIKLTR